MAHATATATERYIDDEKDDEDVCRICRTPGDTDNPLQYPCACKGSIKFVHQDCLLEWLYYCKAHRCEVCKHRFSFSPLYDEKAPTRLSFNEFVLGAAMKVYKCRDLQVFLLFSLVVSLTVSFITFWTLRLAFVRSFGEAQRLLVLSHVSTTVVLTDCLLGFLLSATIIFILHGSASLRNYFRRCGPVKFAFTILASNVIFLGVFIFVPFTLGRVILYQVSCARVTTFVSNLEGQESGLLGQVTVSVATDLLKGFVAEPSKLDDVTTLAVGYMFVVFLVFLYLGIIQLIRYFKGQPLTFGRLSGVIKFACILGVFPLMCGWWLDVCTVSMFGETMSHRVKFLYVSPLASSLVHWVFGMLYMWKIFKCEDLLQEVLRPEDDDDESFQFIIEEPLHKFARDVLLDSAKFGCLIVLLVFLPVKLAIKMAPSVFPLDISVSDPFTEIPASLLLFTTCTQIKIEHFRLLWTRVKSLVRCWFTGAGWALGLTDFLLPRPEDNGNGEPGRQNREQVMQVGAADRTMAELQAAVGNEEQSGSEYKFVLRIILLLLAAWVTLLLLNTALIVVPASLGHALFSAIPTLPTTHGIKCNDLYAFVIGAYALWTTISGGSYAIEHVKSQRSSVLVNQIWKWCGIVIKSSVLLAIWVFVIPVLIGLVFELLVIVPMRVPVDESPVFLLYQDWALGLIVLKIWTRLIVLMDGTWRAKFERVREDGFSRLQGLWVLKEILFPILMKLLTALCVPYVLDRGVFPALVVNSAVYRYPWISRLSVTLFCFCAKRCHVWLINLHNSIRDEHYLIGWRLHNFGDAA